MWKFHKDGGSEDFAFDVQPLNWNLGKILLRKLEKKLIQKLHSVSRMTHKLMMAAQVGLQKLQDLLARKLLMGLLMELFPNFLEVATGR